MPCGQSPSSGAFCAAAAGSAPEGAGVREAPRARALSGLVSVGPGDGVPAEGWGQVASEAGIFLCGSEGEEGTVQ